MNRLLIIDDQREVRDEIEHMLLDMNLGFDKIMHADCARDAIKQINQDEPTIILLDIVMPGDNGFLVAEYIHQHRLQCEVVVMTAFPQFDFVLKAVECRIAAFLIKPIQKEKLQLELLNLLKESQYEQQKQLNLRQHSHLYFKMLDTYLSSETSDASFDVISTNTGLNDLMSEHMAVLVTHVQTTGPIHESLQALSRSLTELALPNIYYVQADRTSVFIIGSKSLVSLTERNVISGRIAAQFYLFSAGLSIQPQSVSLKQIYQQAAFALEYASDSKVCFGRAI